MRFANSRANRNSWGRVLLCFQEISNGLRIAYRKRRIEEESQKNQITIKEDLWLVLLDLAEREACLI